MLEIQICPACQFKNEVSAVFCESCGEYLPTESPPHLITERVAKVRSVQTKLMPSIQDLPDLSPETLVLFMAGQEKPILVENVDEVVLGRMGDGPVERGVDLTDFEAMSLGVSRRHALVQYRDESFMLRDLGSTNGSQLNEEALLPSRSYRLRPFDQITLGRLKLMVYFQADGGESVQTVMVDDVSLSRPPVLTPDYLAEVLLPFLHAMNELQKIYGQCLGREMDSFQVRQIQAARVKALTRLQLAGADEVIQLVRQWIVPWQKINSVATVSEQKLLDEMVKLVGKMAQELFPDASNECRERLLSPVLAVATSGLILTVEVAVN